MAVDNNFVPVALRLCFLPDSSSKPVAVEHYSRQTSAPEFPVADTAALKSAEEPAGRLAAVPVHNIPVVAQPVLQ